MHWPEYPNLISKSYAHISPKQEEILLSHHITLLPHQKYVVKAMLDIESIKKVYSSPDDFINTNVCVLAEPLGSGKTFELIATILLDSHTHTHANTHIHEMYWNTPHMSIVKKMKGYTKVRTTLVFVAKGVFNDWRDILKNTALRVFYIDTHTHMSKFLSDKSYMEYDVVLIKNGKLKEIEGCNSHIGVFNKLSKNNRIEFHRVIYDDFDILHMGNEARVIASRFTWMVTATTKMITKKKPIHGKKCATLGDIMEYDPFIQLMSKDYLYKYLSMKSSPEQIDSSIRPSLIVGKEYIIENLKSTAYRYIDSMVERKDAIEALNSDCIETLESIYGASTIDGLIKKLLIDTIKKFTIAYNICKRAKHVISVVSSSQSIHLPEEQIQLEFKKLKKIIKDGSTIGSTVCNNSLVSLLTEWQEKYVEIRERNLQVILGFFNKLTLQRCYVTNSTHIGDMLHFMPCCGIRVSEGVFAGITQIPFACWKCGSQSSTIDIPTKCISCVDPENDCSVIIKAISDHTTTSSEITNVKTGHILEIITSNFTALNALSKEIRDSPITNGTIMSGTHDYGFSKELKILIFVSTSVALNKLVSIFINEKAIGVLHGPPGVITDLKNRYNLPADNVESINILFVNSDVYCAGVNLQITTDIVLFHKMFEDNIYNQIIGRAARYNRTSNLRVHNIVYENETQV